MESFTTPISYAILGCIILFCGLLVGAVYVITARRSTETLKDIRKRVLADARRAERKKTLKRKNK